MDPKEKARELFDKMCYWHMVDGGSNQDESKQCALIAVDEILQQCWHYRDIDLQASHDYWLKVKHEIENL